MSTQTCTYDQFDLETLVPLNEPTRVRLAEVDFRPELFAGKSVLDIGANSGLLSIEAWKRGASRITAIDVQDPCIESLEAILEHHDIPMAVEKKGVSQLDPEVDTHDIVLFFEVIHWTTAQGMPIPQAIERVANVTADTLIIEFPWDIREPSIRSKTALTIDDYDSSIILSELSDRFHVVELQRFMSYFKGQKGSRRALVRARRRKLSPALFSIDGFRPAVENSVAQGVNDSSYVRAMGQDFFLKRIPPGSSLDPVPSGVLERLFEELDQPGGPVLVPLRLDDRRIHESGDHRVLAYPWLGEDDGSVDFSSRPSVEDALALARSTITALGRVSSEIVDDLRTAGLRSCSQGAALADQLRRNGELAGLSSAGVERVAGLAETVPPLDLDHLVHGDLHRSNMVPVPDGGHVVTDLDTMSIGTHWTDAYWQIGFQALDSAAAADHLDQLESPERRAPVDADILMAVGLLAGWCRTALDAGPVPEAQLARVRQGVGSLVGMLSS